MQKTKVQEMYELLKEGVEMVYSSEAWKELLAFQSRFHKYTWRNMMLIYFQRSNATLVAGLKEWNKLGRRVKLGEHGLKIWAPTTKTVTDEKTGEKVTKRTGFHLTTVFDVSQTHGKELPSVTRELTMETATLRSFYETLKRVCPFPVEEVKIEDGSKGFFDYTTQSISIKKGMAALQKCKTLVHEMAHGFLHSETDKPKQMREVEAEGTAFVVLSYFGFDTKEYSFPYVAGWNGTVDSDVIMQSGETIQKAAVSMIEKIEAEMKKEVGAA